MPTIQPTLRYSGPSLVAASASLAFMALASVGLAQPTTAAELIGLTSNNQLVLFNSAQPTKGRSLSVQGLEGSLIGIDVRPANGMLYGITSSSKIYTINPSTGMATWVSTLNTPFMGGSSAVVDFNPVADRLRLVGSNGQNFRVNVETGAATVDKPLTYAQGDRTMGNPAVSAGAYTNSMAGSKATQLFNIDSAANTLVLQNPPNDGILKTVASLTSQFSPNAGMDILTDAQGGNTAFAVSGGALYTVDLASGKTSSLGMVKASNRPVSLIDVAAMPMATKPSSMGGMMK
jgi:hypothetical protein